MQNRLNLQKRQSPWPTTQVTLLERIQDQEDAVSWKQFVDLYCPVIVKYCQRRGLQDNDARDVAQDVMLYVSKGIDRFRYDPEKGQFRSWLGTITHRAMLKQLANRAKWQKIKSGGQAIHGLSSLAEPSVGEIWMEIFAAQVYRVASTRIRNEFDDVTWHAFLDTFVAGKSADVVADELERTIGWVYQAKSKVSRRLKSEILFLAEDSVLANFVQDHRQENLHG